MSSSSTIYLAANAASSLTRPATGYRLASTLRGPDPGQIDPSENKKSGETMRHVLWAPLLVAMLLSALPCQAQNPNYDAGQVWRVTYYHIKPGQGEAFWKDLREHLKPVWESLKKEGMISDYKVWTNVTLDSPGDWDVAVGLMMANYAAIDQLDAKAATIDSKHYGSREAFIEAGKKRNDLREVVSSRLAREVMPR